MVTMCTEVTDINPLRKAESYESFSRQLGLSGRRIRLRPYRPEDLRELHRWHSDVEQLHLWSPERDIYTFERFAEKFERRLKNRLQVFYMVENIASGQPIGFVYNYQEDTIDGNCYLCCYIEKSKAKTGYGAEACALILNLLFNHFGYRKVYAEIFAFNQASIRLALKAGFIEEGRLKDYRLWSGKYWDQHILAIDRSRFVALLGAHRRYFLGAGRR